MDEFNNVSNTSPEAFTLVQKGQRIHDVRFETKPVGYFQDAWIRFRRNKASVVAAVIIILIVLFGIVAPFCTPYAVSDSDGVYAKMRPKIPALEALGFWDGSYDKKLNERFFVYMTAMGTGYEDTDGTGKTWEEGLASRFNPIRAAGEPYMAQGREFRDCVVDSYYEVGFQYLNITKANFDAIRVWEAESGIQVLYPMVDVLNSENPDDANYWYKHAANGTPLTADGKKMTLEQVMSQGFADNYKRDAQGNIQYYMPKDKTMIQARVFYYNYFQYLHGFEPIHVLGTDAQGYDILVRLAHGVRLSLMLALFVSSINLVIGTVYGALEGYYGGWLDMVLERVSDVLDSMPFIVIAALFQLHLVLPGKVSAFVGLLFAFVLRDWLPIAYRVRTQFYRFKNQEYVLAARTLGAKDLRLMFKHIFPNALGTIITSSVLVIPGVIFTESTLSYLGIVNFNSATMTSIGTMLANGQGFLGTDPHIILFPSIIISLLMISFNLFGNGLRDAFNPSLRGAED